MNLIYSFRVGNFFFDNSAKGKAKIILYQGALNDGRGIEEAILAMHHLDKLKLVIAGEGDLSTHLRKVTEEQGLTHKVEFLGFVLPSDL